ncbi:MAG: CDP-alcohol phosphatidyltransferase family protein [Candidatus Zixiibacteriota bacterium]|nr:MAG: CDP-alcohol phosphatidyltransferase family protein [candidate division Zixibacteria bacterium]
MIDLEKAEKLPVSRRYFNISVIWIFYYRHVLRLLYWLRVPHELVTLASIGSGLFSAMMFYQGKLIPAAILLHFKDVFDACDGSLARITGRGHLIGRYLDSLGDFLVLTSVVIAIGLHAHSLGQQQYLVWGLAAVFSIFIQCSFFNFYQIAYIEQYGIGSLNSKRDETNRDDLNVGALSGPARLLLKLLRFVYTVVYSWQDRLVAAVDNALLKWCVTCPKTDWYGDKPLMVLQSPLCFGTHIFVLIVSALLGRPQYGLVFVVTVMNLYLLFVLYYRRNHFLRRVLQLKPDGEVMQGKEI